MSREQPEGESSGCAGVPAVQYLRREEQLPLPQDSHRLPGGERRYARPQPAKYLGGAPGIKRSEGRAQVTDAAGHGGKKQCAMGDAFVSRDPHPSCHVHCAGAPGNGCKPNGGIVLIGWREAKNFLGGGVAKILVVEDSPDNMKLCRALLALKGHEVIGLPSGEGLLETIRNSLPELVLMDIQLPDKDGFALLREIRDSRFRELRVVALTAHAMAGDRERALSSGFNGYITKPLDIRNFPLQVQRALDGEMVTDS
jgi:two-component system cell cycle response regulator DivK